MFLFFIQLFPTFGQNENIEFSIFSRENCIHGIEIKKFLDENKSNFTAWRAKYYSIDEEKNAKLFEEFATKNHITKVTPYYSYWGWNYRMISFLAWGYFIYEFFTNKDGECKVISWNQKKKTIEKIKYIASKPMTLWVFFVTIFIAFSVNIIEFACSIWIPQAFTKLLKMSSIWFIEKQFHILLYTFFYMIDDFVVFWIAIYAMSYLWVTTKYTRYCLFIWWIIMLILGYFFLFNPIFLKTIIS